MWIAREAAWLAGSLEALAGRGWAPSSVEREQLVDAAHRILAVADPGDVHVAWALLLDYIGEGLSAGGGRPLDPLELLTYAAALRKGMAV